MLVVGNALYIDPRHACAFRLLPNESETRTVYHPKLTLFGFLLYLLGVVGLWLGVDVLTLDAVLRDALDTLKELRPRIAAALRCPT